MFEELTKRLDGVLRGMRGQARMTEDNVAESLREVRQALLEADVNFAVARDFVGRVREKALGRDVLQTLQPGQQIVKIVHEELVELLGGERADLQLAGTPAVVLIAGLQGSGKTTFAAKLALHLSKRGRKPLLVAADVQRPAAIEQLRLLAAQVDVPVYARDGERDVPRIVRDGRQEARQTLRDVVLVDTAGRTHVDEELMQELEAIRDAVEPRETLLVLDAMTGQEAVNVAQVFDRRIALSGVVLTKLDGDARGGAALSLRSVLGKPIKFVGVGERLEDLEPFHPDRMAQRILGMGDVLTLVEKAEAVYDEEQARELERKMRRQALTLEDFLDQLQAVRRMGPLEKIVGMIPGLPAGGLAPGALDAKRLDRVQGIVHSMTPVERRNPRLIDGSRRRRIATGSGTSVQEVNQLLGQFDQMKKMMKSMTSGPRGAGGGGLATRNATRAVLAGQGRVRYGSKRKRRKK